MMFLVHSNLPTSYAALNWCIRHGAASKGRLDRTVDAFPVASTVRDARWKRHHALWKPTLINTTRTPTVEYLK